MKQSVPVEEEWPPDLSVPVKQVEQVFELSVP